MTKGFLYLIIIILAILLFANLFGVKRCSKNINKVINSTTTEIAK